MMGYLKHEDGLVVNSAVLLHQHVLNKVDVEDVWRKKVSILSVIFKLKVILIPFFEGSGWSTWQILNEG